MQSEAAEEEVEWGIMWIVLNIICEISDVFIITLQYVWVARYALYSHQNAQSLWCLSHESPEHIS